jgi:hypothetical protein
MEKEDHRMGVGCQISKVEVDLKKSTISFSGKLQTLETPSLSLPLPRLYFWAHSFYLTHLFSLKLLKLSTILISFSYGQSQCVSIGPWCFKIEHACTASWTNIRKPNSASSWSYLGSKGEHRKWFRVSYLENKKCPHAIMPEWRDDRQQQRKH